MKMNISQAAKAVGKSRKTLYRHIDAGKISVEKDATDSPVIDVSELQRVYGRVDIDVTTNDVGQKDTVSQSATPSKPANDKVVETLKLRLEYAEKERDTERERRLEAEKREQDAQRREEETRSEVRRLLEIVENHTRQLPAPKEEEAPAEIAEALEQPSRRGFWASIFGGKS